MRTLSNEILKSKIVEMTKKRREVNEKHNGLAFLLPVYQLCSSERDLNWSAGNTLLANQSGN